MSYELRGRTVAFDNIAVGAATGRERTINGVTPSTEGVVGGQGSSTDPAGGTSGVSAKHVTNICVSPSYQQTSDPLDNYVGGSITPHAERLG